ncbi:DUF937 domain-containing protein [soil metagenome]
MNPLIGMLADRLGGNVVQQISARLRTDPRTTARAVAVALPVLVGALSRNTRQPQGAQALMGAIDQHHDGSILDQPDGLDVHPQAGKGASILRHLLGDRQQAVAEGVSNASGLDMQKAMPLLLMLAPLVMGALGQARKEGVLASKGGAGELASVLDQRSPELDPLVPPRPGKGAGLAGILDANDDGQIADDIARLGSSVLGGGGLSGLFGALLGGRK